MMTNPDVLPLLTRIADALDRIAPAPVSGKVLTPADGYVWDKQLGHCQAVPTISRIPLSLLKGIQPQIDKLYANTKAFAEGKLANNALLWGARGTGKSSIIKAVHGQIQSEGYDLAIIEIAREDIEDLPRLMQYLATQDRSFIVFCDDLAFEAAESSYKALKAALEGGLTGRPSNVVFYASSNRRHLMSRQMIENERSSAVNPSEATEEKVSLSDRFGLWIGFHSLDQDAYLTIVNGYISHFALPISEEDARSLALQWAMERGNRSGRTAAQFIVHLAAKLDQKISF
ncbi:MAG: ATP-binding protein [Candidatus Puniceispirillaceae bacterium]